VDVYEQCAARSVDDVFQGYNGTLHPRHIVSASMSLCHIVYALSLSDRCARSVPGTIFAYGQTGSGKSWSMMGDKTSDVQRGIIPRASQASRGRQISSHAPVHMSFAILHTKQTGGGWGGGLLHRPWRLAGHLRENWGDGRRHQVHGGLPGAPLAP
jgi:hypothetical protein